MKPNKSHFYAMMSIISITLTLIFSTIVHLYTFGLPAIIMGFVFVALVHGIAMIYRKTHNRIFLIFYGCLNFFIILGHGLYSGFWNHFVKVSIFYMHNNQLPPLFAKLFDVPEIGSFVYESFGILTFVASMVAAYYTYATIKSLNKETCK